MSSQVQSLLLLRDFRRRRSHQRSGLTAEEVRAEADGFNSASARATMRIVAETWDRMAEDLERRLTRRL